MSARSAQSSLGSLPVADPWFVTSRGDHGITHIVEPHVHPLLRCNVWVVAGRDRDIVVDSSLGIRPLRGIVERDFDHELLAVATHAHSDHVGGLHEFDHRAAHSAAGALISEPDLVVLDATMYPESVTGPYARAGYDIPDLFIDAVPAGGLDAAIFERPATTLTRSIDEGDVVDLGDRHFEVLHLPGHSPGSIGLFEPATGVLFSGDAVYDGPLLDELQESDVAVYIATMKRLRQVPVSVVHAGHEPSFGRDRLIELCDAYLAANA